MIFNHNNNIKKQFNTKCNCFLPSSLPYFILSSKLKKITLTSEARRTHPFLPLSPRSTLTTARSRNPNPNFPSSSSYGRSTGDSSRHRAPPPLTRTLGSSEFTSFYKTSMDLLRDINFRVS
ncbi:putative sugar phosphate/phosphate translocator [Iris pallida]|uniref:Sugar phosphate/phosphate translocator n=1 Tax=Iris pallida TaxID=29817 RepID=A0AAX6H6A8_IRIPA|nr:putative sugar phosphate/phosphate translocator [Iris pallida]